MDPLCKKKIAESQYVREIQSHSCEWLKSSGQNGGNRTPTVALVNGVTRYVTKGIGLFLT